MAARKLNQQQIADALGISRPAVSQKLSGKHVWTLDDIEKVSDFLHVKPETLLVAGHGFEPWTSGL